MRKIVLFSLLLLLPLVAQAQEPTAPKPPAKPAPPPFIIGVWYQPMSSFQVWKARAVNTLVGYESESNHVSVEDWTGTAALNELFMITEPRAHVPNDPADPYTLAWMHHDEPDIQKPPTDPAALADDYADWKRTDPDRPVFVNVSGGNVLFRKVPQATYKAYFKAADWVGNDFYPVSGWADPKLMPKLGEIVDTLRDWSGGKPQFAFIETAEQKLSWTPPNTPGVTPDQFRAEVWDAVIHGAHGIIYFPQSFGGGFKYDATPSSVSIEMAKQDQLLTDLGPVLNTPANPDAVGVSTDFPIQATWRKTGEGVVYIFALNLSSENRRAEILKLTGVKASTATLANEEGRTLTISHSSLIDDFTPYQVHIYTIKPE